MKVPHSWIKTCFVNIVMLFAINTSSVAEEKEPSQIYMDSIYVYAHHAYTDSSEAENMRSRLMNLLEKDKYKYKQAIWYLYEAIRLEGNDQIQNALKSYEKCLYILEDDYKSNPDALYIYFCYSLYHSNLLMFEYKYLESLKILYDLEIAVKKFHPEWLVEVYNNLASIYNELEEKHLMNKYFSKASFIAKESAPLETYLTIRLNQASLAYTEKQYKEAQKHLSGLEDSLSLQDNSYAELEEMYWSLYALNAYELGQIDASKKALKELSSIEEKDLYYRAKALMLEMKLAKRDQKLNLIPVKAQKAYNILVQYENPHLMKDFYTNMQEVYIHNKDSLLKYYKLYMIYEDSVRNISHSDIMLSMEKRQSLYDLDNEYQNLSHELEQELQYSRIKNVLLIAVICILILIVVVSYLIWLKNKNLKLQLESLVKNNQLVLSDQNVKTQSEEESLKEQKTGFEKSPLIQGWERIMKQEKRYTDADVNLGQIAKELDTNTSYLSSHINQYYGKNFNKIINEFRIKECLSLLHNEAFRSYTIEHLANKSGFRSMSSFYGVFKEATGVTPKQYLKELEKQLELNVKNKHLLN